MSFNKHHMRCILEELNPLIDELSEGIAVHSIASHISYEEILAQVAVAILHKGED